MWVVVKIMVPFWVPNIVRHLSFRVPNKRDPNFDNYPCILADMHRIRGTSHIRTLGTAQSGGSSGRA